MLQYMIIMLDDTATSFCHYENGKTERKAIPIDTLRKAIRFAMTENLMIQFLYPEHDLPEEIKVEIETIDHSKIKPFQDDETDVVVVNDRNFYNTDGSIPIVLRTDKSGFFANQDKIAETLSTAKRLNIVITDIEKFTDEDFTNYKETLERLSKEIEKLYVEGKSPQLNILTDRMMLKQMNNCGAGDTTITLAPNGKFYVCAAFYHESESDSVGDLDNGLDIKNRQLFKLDHAPICRKCDAWQCRRCAWLNRKTTLEVNTPSHEQCVVAHLERNASKALLEAIRPHGTFLPEVDAIKEIDYLDPFDKREEWS